MTVYFNNSETTTTASNLDAFLHEFDLNDKRGIAVALNETVISRVEWLTTPLQENDKILVITATQGG